MHEHEWHLWLLIDHDAGHVGWRVACEVCDTEAQWGSIDAHGRRLPSFAP